MCRQKVKINIDQNASSFHLQEPWRSSSSFAGNRLFTYCSVGSGLFFPSFSGWFLITWTLAYSSAWKEKRKWVIFPTFSISLLVLSSTTSHDHESQGYSNATGESLVLHRLLSDARPPLVVLGVIRSLHVSSYVLSEEEKSILLSAIEISFLDLYSLQDGVMQWSIGVAVGFGLLQIFVIF